MLRFAVLILCLVASSFALRQHSQPHTQPKAVSAHDLIPIRFPVQNVSNTTYAVPSWLGLFIFTNSTLDSTWNLPANYVSGGPVMLGQVMIVTNTAYGSVLLVAAGAELIDGQQSITVYPFESIMYIAIGTGWLSVAQRVS